MLLQRLSFDRTKLSAREGALLDLVVDLAALAVASQPDTDATWQIVASLVRRSFPDLEVSVTEAEDVDMTTVGAELLRAKILGRT